jgi:hypothetical protein
VSEQDRHEFRQAADLPNGYCGCGYHRNSHRNYDAEIADLRAQVSRYEAALREIEASETDDRLVWQIARRALGESNSKTGETSK